MAPFQITHYRGAIALLLVWIAAALAVGLSGDFPLNDDWQYAYPVKQWVETGQPSIKARFSPNILTQVVWGALFCKLGGGFSFECLRWSTWVAAGLGGLGFFRLLRLLSVSLSMATVGTAVLLFSPLYFHLSFSFMTDVPFLALVIWAAWAGLRFQQSRHVQWSLIFTVLSLLAYLNRQPGILLFPAMGGWYLLQQRGGMRGWLWAGLSVAVAASAYLLLENTVKPWLGISENYLPVSGHLLQQLREAPGGVLAQLGRQSFKSWVYLGAFCLPLLPFLWSSVRAAGVLRLWPMTGILVANTGLLIAQHDAGHVFPYGGNILYNWGLGPELLGDVYTFQLRNTPRLPIWMMYGLGYISQLSASLLTWVGLSALRELNQKQQDFFLFLLLLNLANFLAMSVTGFFDRYMLLSVASAILFLATLAPKPQAWFKGAVLLIFALFSMLATHDYLAWNRARAQAFEWLKRNDIRMQRVDAGYEYNGWHHYHPARKGQPGKSWWWVDDDEWMIAFGPRPGYVMQAGFTYQRWLRGGRPDRVWVLRREP
jgi:hypothetical protein